MECRDKAVRVGRCESKILRLTFRSRMKAGEDGPGYKKGTSWDVRATWRKMQLPTMVEKNAEKVWKPKGWRSCDDGTAVNSEMADYCVVMEQECLEHAFECLKVEAPMEFSQQKRGVGHSCGEVDKRGERLGTGSDEVPSQR